MAKDNTGSGAARALQMYLRKITVLGERGANGAASLLVTLPNLSLIGPHSHHAGYDTIPAIFLAPSTSDATDVRSRYLSIIWRSACTSRTISRSPVF
jgi:hypothetical protein